ELRVVFGGEVLRLRESELGAVRRSVAGRVQRPNLARPEARRALVDALWRARPRDVSWNPKRFVEEIPDRSDFIEFLRLWWPTRTPVQVLAGLADRRKLSRAAGSDLTGEEMSLLIASW